MTIAAGGGVRVRRWLSSKPGSPMPVLTRVPPFTRRNLTFELSLRYAAISCADPEHHGSRNAVTASASAAGVSP